MIVNANALTMPMADGSVQCCVTSPPYYGLRDYKVTGQLGLEPTPDEYIANLVAVGREVWRVLADDGVYFLNLGDSYVNNPGNGRGGERLDGGLPHRSGKNKASPGLKPKDLMMIPARVALALQADGWYVRAEIVWAKPNPIPESVTDRPIRSHEMIYLLTKRKRYYYDADAVREAGAIESAKRLERGVSDHHKNVYGAPGQTPHSMHEPRAHISKSGGNFSSRTHDARRGTISGGPETGRPPDTGYRNQRDVWSIATQSYAGAHYATFPTEIPRRAILAGSRKGDIILDPFCGSGTTGQVCRELGRRFVGLDLSMKYLLENALPRAERKTASRAVDSLPLFAEIAQ